MNKALRVLLVTVGYLAAGVIFYRVVEEKECSDVSETEQLDSHQKDGHPGCTESWTVIDALYFSVVTISTVGYGDLIPSTDASRLFTMIYIFFGITIVFSEVAGASAGGLAALEVKFLRLLDRCDYSGQRVSGQQLGLSGKKVDLSGDGMADFVVPPGSVTFWTQRLGPWIVIAILLQLVSAAVLCAVQDDLNYFDAFYHGFVTATTVGYGDKGLTTQGARTFAIFHVIVSVTFFAALVGRVQELGDVRTAELHRADILMKHLDEDWIASVCKVMDTDGGGVDKLEFVIGMLTNMGVQLCGQPLEWCDVKPLLAQFEAADKTHDGRLNEEDLRKLAKERKKQHAYSLSMKPEAAAGTTAAKIAPDVNFDSTF